MTKQEYEKKYDECNNWLGNIRVCRKYIASLEAENAALTLLHTQATDEMLKMQNRVHELEAENAKLKANAIVWHRYPEEKPIIGHIYNVTCYHESCLIDKYRVIYGVVYSNENDNEQFYAELWNHSLDKSYLTKVACVIAFSDPINPYLPAPPKEESNGLLDRQKEEK